MLRSITCLLPILIISLIGCKRTTELDPEIKVNEVVVKNHLVSFEQAKDIALLSTLYPIISTPENQKIRTATRTAGNKAIAGTLSINYSQNQPSFYIFNFKEGGFSIVSGDDRLYPVLAYSETGTFPIDSTLKYPSGLVGWLASTDELVGQVRKKNLIQSKEVRSVWSNLQLQSKVAGGRIGSFQLPECYTNGQIYTYAESFGPFVATKWGQGVGYNNALNSMGCSTYSNGRPPVGCVATATAQIMAFHKYPTNLDWLNMPNSFPSVQTAQLMADLGSHLNMDYSCDGSGTQTEKAASVLRNNYGYRSASWNDTYQSATVYQELKQGRPVILSGGRKDKWWFFNVYADGHAWVCDGVNSISQYICEHFGDDGDPYSTDYTWNGYGSNMLLHMNWGWNGSSYDGYYLYNNFNPGSNTFNYKTGMITSIIP